MRVRVRVRVRVGVSQGGGLPAGGRPNPNLNPNPNPDPSPKPKPKPNPNPNPNPDQVFQRADAPERKAMLQAVADEVQAEVDAAEKSRAAALAKRPAWIVAKEAALRQNKYNVLLPLPKAPASKFVAVMRPQLQH